MNTNTRVKITEVGFISSKFLKHIATKLYLGRLTVSVESNCRSSDFPAIPLVNILLEAL